MHRINSSYALKVSRYVCIYALTKNDGGCGNEE